MFVSSQLMTDVERLADRMFDMRFTSRIVFETANYTCHYCRDFSFSICDS